MYALKRTSSLAAAIIAILTLAPAQTLRPSSQSKEATCSISGRVTIVDLPAPGVTVLVLSAEPGPNERPLAKGTTDQDGRFHLTGVPAGQHILQAFAPAFIAPSDNMTGRSGKVVYLTAGEAVEGLDIVLTRGAAITGRVTDAEGQPLILENVRLFAVQEQGRKVPVYLPNGSFSVSATDDRGVYRLFGVPPGRYVVSVGVDSDQRMSRSASGNQYYALTYHPDVTDEAKATVVEVAAGSEATGVDVVVGRVEKAYSVSGRIIDADTGKPLVAIPYGCSSVGPEGRPIYSTSGASTSAARGEFRIDGLGPGRYSAFAVPTPDSGLCSDTTPFTILDADVGGIVIKVRPGSSIVGTVVVEGAENQRGTPRLSDMQVGVSSSSPNAPPRVGLLSIAPDGSFRATGVPSGVANFIVYSYPANKGLTLVRVERDGVAQKENGIAVGLAEEISGVKVVFAYGTGSIRGQVQVEGGEIQPGAMMYIRLQRIGVQDQGRRPPVPDSRGRFAVDGLLPGEYEISLTYQIRAVNGSLQMGPKFVKQTVTVTNGAETQVTMIVDRNEKNR